MEIRDQYARLLKRIDRMGETLASLTNNYFSGRGAQIERIGFLQCYFGLRAWSAVRATRGLLRLRRDDQIGLVARHLFELATIIEYISTDTARKCKACRASKLMSKDDKIDLFFGYGEIKAEKSGGKRRSREMLEAAKAHRKNLDMRDNRTWHGATIFDLCKELDEAKPRGGPDTRQSMYKKVYGILSFLFAHPNFAANPWLEVGSDGSPRVLHHWTENAVIDLVAVFSLEVYVLWDLALGRPRSRYIRKQQETATSLAKKDYFLRFPEGT